MRAEDDSSMIGASPSHRDGGGWRICHNGAGYPLLLTETEPAGRLAPG